MLQRTLALYPLMLLLPHYAATATLLGRAHTTGVLPRAGPRMLQQADTFSMASLSQRIAEVQSQPEPEVVRLLMLDAMLPRQRLELAAPANLVRTIVDCQESNTSLVVVALTNVRFTISSMFSLWMRRPLTQ